MIEIAKKLQDKGFSKNQIEEIEAGIRDGVDISKFASKDFLAIQMRQIRIGLQEGLPVEKYARPEYDWFQMEEIRKGLEDGIDIARYASPEISHDRMQQLRLGLKKHIDLSPYRKLDAGILKQLRLALLDRINIVTYINDGYDAEQLEAIREALEKQIDIKPWVRKEYRGIALKEIFTGLDNGLDVTAYANPEYGWQQMREIRLGMEHMVDIEKYKSVFYSYRQMQQIRIGLEEDLDVSYYSSPMYTSSEMEKRRLYLEKHPEVLLPKDKNAEFSGSSDTPDEILVQRYILTVSEDEMEAYLEVKGSADNFNRIDILKVLHKHNICYGIRYDRIDKIISGDVPRKPILIAAGKPVIDGTDGWYEFFFMTEAKFTPKQLEDGNVDYRKTEWFEIVEQGQKLAYYHRAMVGENGVTVTGTVLTGKKGREKNILTGKGMKRLADGVTYIATMKGIASIDHDKLNVSEVLVVPEVNMATGDLEYDGNILVEGNVSSGSTIRATKNIIIRGYVEDAQLISGGSVYMYKGMNGSGGGCVKAGENVIGTFFENVEIHADGDIKGDYFFKSNLYAEGMVRASGKKGSIAGGVVQAVHGLKTIQLGNTTGLVTGVKIGLLDSIHKKEEKLNEQINNVNQELMVFRNTHNEFQKKYTSEIRNTIPIYLKVESAIYTKEKELESLLADKKKLAQEMTRADDIRAEITGTLYEGVYFDIDGISWQSQKASSVIIKKANKKISVFAYHK